MLSTNSSSDSEKQETIYIVYMKGRTCAGATGPSKHLFSVFCGGGTFNLVKVRLLKGLCLETLTDCLHSPCPMFLLS